MDPEIAPLARRLAEENNVDWRRLSGSGSEGRIVERDVLDFLARVMAGEEDVDPTPEPLPDGLDAWPEEGDAPIGAPTAERDAGRGGDPHEAREAEAASGDDDLLLAGDDLIDADDDDDLLLAGGDAYGTATSRDVAPDLFAEDDAGPERREPAPDLFLDDDAGDEHDGRPGEGDAEDEDAGFDFGGLPGVREPREGPRDDGSGAGDMGAVDMDADDMDTDDAGAVDMDVEDLDAHGQDPRRSGAEEKDVGGPTLDDGDADDLSARDDDAEDLGTRDAPRRDLDAHDLGAPDGGAPDLDAPDLEASDLDRPDRAASERATGAEHGDAPRAAAPNVPVPDPTALPLVRSRSVLRRHVDFGPALEVRRSVALEAGRDELPAAAVLLAAARRVAATIDAARPGVAVHGHGGQVRAVVPDGTGLAAIASAIAASGDDGRDDGDVDLWIVDLSDIGIDEVVLDVEAPQLVLGRVMTDGDDGSVRATLSLVADLPIERGSAFLSRVADLIEEPLRLLA